jgi:ABC-2 type transport system permease protein
MRWDVVRVVAGREVHQRIRARSFAVATVFLLVVVLAVVIVPAAIPDHKPHFDVGVVDGSPSLQHALVALHSTVGGVVAVHDVSNDTAAQQEVDDGTLDLALLPARHVMLVRKQPDSGSALARMVSAAQFVAGLERAGIDPGRATAAVRDGYTLHALQPKQKDEAARRGIASIAIVLLFLTLVNYGNWISSGVIEEKSTRIIEVLLPAASADELLTGKVLGISIVGFTQFGIMAVAGLFASLSVGKHIPAATPSIIVAAIGCFVAGYAFYAALFAAAGSLVSRQEDVGSAAVPVTMLLTAAYLAALAAPPGSALVAVGSFLPPFAPMLLVARYANGSAPWWQVVTGLAITLAAAALAMRATGRLYRGSLLRRGPKLRLRDAWQAANPH